MPAKRLSEVLMAEWPGVDGIDGIDRNLLVELQANARLTAAELGRRVALSAPAVAERLRRLEHDGVIVGYRAELAPRALGFGFGALIRVRPMPSKLAKVADLLRAIPEVVECHRVTGDDCYVATAYVRDVEHLEQVIDRLAPHGQTITSVIQSSPVPRRALALGEAIDRR